MKTQKSYKINYFQEIDSTNIYAVKNLADLTNGEVIISNVQTSGKGRLNREWVSDGKDNVYLSIVLKPSKTINKELPLANLTQYMSVVLCKVLENYGVEPEIKWPNDVLVNGRKIAGILSQISVHGEKLRGFVLGVGVNLNLSQEDAEKIDQPATSLNLELGKPVDKKAFTEELLDTFFENYELFLKTGFGFIKKDYINKSGFIGKRIAVRSLDSINTGVAKEIGEDGSLILVNDDMQEKIITMGDIICL